MLRDRILRAASPRQRLSATYRSVFEGPEGRVVLADIMRSAGMTAVSHAPGDSHETAFNEGRRALALQILAHLRWSEGDLIALSQARAPRPEEDDA